jgi:5,10-methylenetetrahydromethanopterin reductase
MPGPVKRTIKSVLEAIQCIDAILSGRGYQGDTFSFPKERRLRWLRRHGAEIYVGTSGPKLASRASRLEAVQGIVVDNLWHPGYARRMRAVIDDSAAQAKRKSRVELIARPFTMVAKDRADAEKRMLPVLSRYLPQLVGDSPMLAHAGLTYEEILALSRNPPKAPPDFLHHFAALGSPDDVIEQTAQMVAAGVDQVCFGHPLGPDLPAAIRLLGENVLPHFPRNQSA